MILTNLDISSKEKCLTGLHQNQNFGQVALEFYLAEALSNLPEFYTDYEVEPTLPVSGGLLYPLCYLKPLRPLLMGEILKGFLSLIRRSTFLVAASD